MNMRERILAVVKGYEHDRVPFVQYSGTGGPDEEVLALLGSDNIGILRWVTVHRTEAPNCRWEVEDITYGDLKGIRQTLHTPNGSLIREAFYERGLGTLVTKRHFIREAKDYLALIAYLNDLIVIEDLEQFTKANSELGDQGIPHVRVDRTPFQQLWIEWVSLNDLCLHMVDYPDIINDVFQALDRHITRVFEVVRKVVSSTPIPYVVFPDNITAPAIGERYYRKYCMPYYAKLADMLSDYKVPVYVHMDGDLKPLWTAIAESNILGIDSLSPPPDNDTSAGKAVELWPEMRVGVNFPSSVHLATSQVIRETAEQILAEAGHTGRLQIQISENVPPGVWQKSFPIIASVIQDFGRPV
jgi:hypothetical protein